MTPAKSQSHKTLSFFHIVMINVIAVDSIRTLPFAAQFGFSLVFYYLLAAIFFLVPSALISAELGTGWPKKGGLYVWVREAFGLKWALIAIWLNWIYNLAWYPTIMALIAGTSAYLFLPSLAENPLYITLVSLALFWIATYANCHGMRISSLISTVGAIGGTLFPMCLIIILAIIWLMLGHPSQISFSSQAFWPSSDTPGQLGFFSNVLFGLIGLEMVATHAQEMKDPERDYPKATLVSACIVILTIVFSSLAIAIVVPYKDLNLIVGVLQAFHIFFEAFHAPFLTFVLAICIILGGLSAVSAWIIGPTKGLLVAGEDQSLPPIFAKTNQHGVPVGALIIQAIVVTFLSLAFLLLPSVNSSFAILSIITAQLALIVYCILFAAAIKLRYHKPEIKRHFKVPGGSMGIWALSLSGIAICLFAIALGFIPPMQTQLSSLVLYELLIVGGMGLLALLPILIQRLSKGPKRG